MTSKESSILKKALLWGILVLIIVGGYFTLYRNQDTIINKWIFHTQSTPLAIQVPNKVLRDEMTAFVDRNPDVIGIQIVDVDLVTNTRNNIWYYTDVPELKTIYDDYLKTRIGATPWLLGDTYLDQISRQLSTISVPKLLCMPFSKAPLSQRAHVMTQFITDLCVTSIPVQGTFNGYLSVWLKRSLSPEEKKELAKQMIAFSNKIQPSNKAK